MKTTMTIMECGNNSNGLATLSEIASNLRAKITNKVCISAGIVSAMGFVVALAAVDIPLILVTGFIALMSVAIAPQNS